MKYLALLAPFAIAQVASACATCSGPADAPQSHGMNAAILTLFCVLGLVGLAFLGFAGAIAWRVAKHQTTELLQSAPQPTSLAGLES